MDNVDELFDIQLMLFVRWFSIFDFNEINVLQCMVYMLKKLKYGYIDDDVLVFVIFFVDGKMLLYDGDNGQDILYCYCWEGFDNGYLKDDNDFWCFLWLNLVDGKYCIVVGQEWDYCEDMVLVIVVV